MSKFNNLHPNQLRNIKEGLIQEKKLYILIRDAILNDDVRDINTEIEKIAGDIGEIIERQRNKDYKR